MRGKNRRDMIIKNPSLKKELKYRKNYRFGTKQRYNRKGKPTKQRKSIGVLVHKRKYCKDGGGSII